MSPDTKSTSPEGIFVGGGEMGALMRSHDWSQTPLGSVETWTQSLRTIISVLLNSRYPMFVFWGPKLVKLYNDGYRPILGSNKHPQALGKPGPDVWPEIWDTIGPMVEQVMSRGEATWSDNLLLFMQRSGYPEEVYFTFSYSPVRDETGGVGGMFCACTETTQQVLGDRRLRTLRAIASDTAQAKTVEEACQIAVETLPTNPYDIPFALLYLVERDGKQARLVETAGIEPETAASPALVNLTQAMDDWNLIRVCQAGQVEIVNNLAARFGVLPEGVWSDTPSAAAVMPLAQSGQKQQLAGFLVLGISPRRAFDDEYQGFFDLVASHVATAIANVDAYEAERRRAEALAELDRAKTAFFSNVSHEFRTPLTLMLNPLEATLANSSGLLPDDRDSLEVVYRNSQRLLRLVNTLLDFSRIEAGRIEAVYEPTDLAMLTTDLAGVFRSAIEGAEMRLRVDCPSLPEPAYVDRTMWEKIVLNLLSNAFKFTFEGEIAVVLRSCDNHIELAVQDTGIGIPAEELPHIFERFHRVRGARGRSYEGSGIGLSLVQELVRLHGGTVGVSSVVDQGTCFTVSIPTGCAHLPSERIGALRTLTSTATGATTYLEELLRWSPKSIESSEALASELYLSSPVQSRDSSAPTVRILLADDNADMRDYLKRLLSQQYEVETVTDGVAALAAVRQQRPDLLLADVMMPRLDGFELLRLLRNPPLEDSLRSDPTTRKIPIILLSARAGEESRIEGLEAGADDYLIKPFSARELLARVEATLKLAQMRQEAARCEQTLRVEAEAAREQVCTILESITAAFVAFDHQWRYTYVNEQVTRLLHKTREELLGKQVWEVFPDRVGTLGYRELHQAVTEQVAIVYEDFNPTLGIWLEAHAYPSSDGLAVYFQDITDRKQAEEALRQREAELDLVTNAVPALISFVDSEQRYRFNNRGYEEWFGHSATEICGRRIREVLGETAYEGIRPYVEQVLAGQQVTFESQVPYKNGGTRYVSATYVPLFSSQGAVEGFVALVNDISDRKRAETEREHLLAREQAVRAEAERANRVKDEFLAIVSHELRSPLNPILGWATLLQSGNLDETKTAQALTTIERNAKLQSELIEDLLDVSRILRGKLSLNVAPVDLVPTIQAAMETVQLAAEAKSIDLRLTILDSELDDSDGNLKSKIQNPKLQVSGDPNRLQQVVWNLISNAVKFTGVGGKVDVRLERFDSQAQISVSDTGKGIHPDFLPNVFEYLRQEDGATTRKFGGLGLGLAIVRHLVELHGGTVWAESPGEGQGATFTVRLPLMPNSPQTNPDHKSSEPSLNLQGIKVLVVDDETDTREFLTFLLEMYGANVTAAASAVEALATLAQYRIHLRSQEGAVSRLSISRTKQRLILVVA